MTLEGVIDEFLPGVSMIEIIEHHLKDTQDVQQMAAEELKELALQSRKALHGTLEALSQAGLVTDMLTRGELKMNLDFSGSQDPIEDLSHIADRLTMGIIIAGLLIILRALHSPSWVCRFWAFWATFWPLASRSTWCAISSNTTKSGASSCDMR